MDARGGASCESCRSARPVLKRPKNGARLCKGCFFDLFESEVHETIVRNALFRRGQRVAIAASGGKDSTVLAHVLSVLNERHDYGLDLFLLSIDEGITGYRDDSLECVRRNRDKYALPLTIVSYKELYGWAMDDIVAALGTRNNCTFCGVFRRQALDRGAALVGADVIATGHNADDVAETVLMNLLRGDVARLGRCVAITTGGDGGGGRGGGAPASVAAPSDGAASAASAPRALGTPAAPAPPLRSVPRCKPLKWAYEKEIVLYAYHKRLDYHSTECVYSPHAYRGFAREFLKDLEAVRPRAIVDIILSAEAWRIDETVAAAGGGGGGGDDTASVRTGNTCASAGGATAKLTARPQTLSSCLRCGYMTSRGGGGGGGAEDGGEVRGCGGVVDAHLIEPSGRGSGADGGPLCQACTLLAGLAAGTPRVGVVSERQARRMRAAAGAVAADAGVGATVAQSSSGV